MPEEIKTKIAVIAEEQGLQDYIALMLIGENYEVKAYPTQEDAFQNLETDLPDLIISDFQSPNINGLNICRILRKNFLFLYTPLIFILSDKDALNKAKLIYAGADDYIYRASIQDDLILKVKLNLYRVSRQHDINPLTRLPGQASLIKELQKRIEAKNLFAVSYLDLYKFKQYNHRYGFAKGDDVIRHTGSLIIDALKEFGSPSDFLSHPRSEDFVLLTLTDSVDAIINKTITDFDKSASSFYDEDDKKRGYLVIKTRSGDIEKIPLLRIHIGITTNEHYAFQTPAQVLQIAGELKNFAEKSFPDKSMHVKERRKNYPFY